MNLIDRFKKDQGCESISIIGGRGLMNDSNLSKERLDNFAEWVRTCKKETRFIILYVTRYIDAEGFSCEGSLIAVDDLGEIIAEREIWFS